MNAIYKFFRSVKLAVVLILVIILFALLSTLFPQGKEAAFYQTGFSPLVSGLILATGLDNYTSSLLFVVPAALFILNLGTCTVSRLVTRARNKATRHFGPDLIHVGLLVLFAGALVTATLRTEQDFTMAPGDAVNLPGGYTMSLSNFEFLKYEGGRPKAWISTVDLSKDGKVLRKDVKIEVNHPLKVGGLKVYQTNYSSVGVIDLVEPSGNKAVMKTGQGLAMGEYELWFAGVRAQTDPSLGPVAQFEVWKGQEFQSSAEFGVGDRLGSYGIATISTRDITGLRAAEDPGFIPVLVSLVIIGIGLTLTSIHKSKSKGDL